METRKVFRVDLGLTIDVEANTSEEAEEKALEQCNSFYSASVLEVEELDEEEF